MALPHPSTQTAAELRQRLEKGSKMLLDRELRGEFGADYDNAAARFAEMLSWYELRCNETGFDLAPTPEVAQGTLEMPA